MRLFLLGATEGTGRALIDQALKRGHQVTAFVRSPEKLATTVAGLTVVRGNPRSEADLSAALGGHDAVVSALSPPGPGRTTILRDGAQSTVAAMERTVMDSGFDWTIARPPRLTDGPLTGHYRIEDGKLPCGRLVVSRADVAHFLLGELECGRHSRQIVGMAGAA